MLPSQDLFNATNRGVYIADNLDFLRALNDECIDLVCIDPPFAKNDTFTADRLKPPLTDGEEANERRLMNSWGIRSEREAERAGIVWPAARSGGYKDIWSWESDIHEDWLRSLDASYRGVSLAIEGAQEVSGDSMAAYLCYMAVRIIELHRVLKSSGSIYLHCDKTADYYLHVLLSSVFGSDNFRSQITWRRSPGRSHGRIWGNTHDTILNFTKSDEYVWNDTFVNPDGANQAGLPKTTIGADVGSKVDDVWTDIKLLSPTARERTGYPTQKPIALAERMIAASSNPGDIVLDCFAGCASAGVAAERLGRRWLVCDLNVRAWTVFKRQFNKPHLALLRCNDVTTDQQVLGNEPVVTVHGPNDLPIRTTEISEIEPGFFRPRVRKFKVPSSIIPEQEMLTQLLELSDYQAWCCGYANRMPDASIIRTTRNFHLDHIDPKSKQGSNDIPNRAPMCPYHNTRKGNRRVHLADYREEIAHAGEMMVATVHDLIDLSWAHQQALEIYAKAYGRRNPGL